MRAARGSAPPDPAGTGQPPLPMGKPRRKDVVSRSRNLTTLTAIIITAITLAAVVAPEKAEAASLKGKLRSAKKALRHSEQRLKRAEAALAEVLVVADPAAVSASSAAPGTATTSTAGAAPAATAVQTLKARVTKARRAVRVWKQRVRRLTKSYRFQRKMAEWERRAKWMPIIEVAAAKYHVKADGMYRMMMRESGGRRFAGADSPYKGLFQYWTGTWSASWNPYRHDSIYDGSSQIFATAYAISRGMGPRMWTTTFASQY